MDYLDTWSKDRTHETAEHPFDFGMEAFAASPVGSISGLDPTKLALCTDVSHWQGDIDFAKLKAGRVSLVFPKASDGKQVRPGGAFEITNYIDDYLYRNVQGCHDNKIACAPYHYVQPYLCQLHGDRDHRRELEPAKGGDG